MQGGEPCYHGQSASGEIRGMKSIQKMINVIVGLMLLVGLFGLPKASEAQELAVVKIEPVTQTVAPGQQFEVRVRVEDVADLYAFEIQVNFPPGLMSVTGVENGDFLELWSEFKSVDNSAGLVRLDVTQKDPSSPKSGSGTLMVIHFHAKATLGEGDLEIIESLLASYPDMLPVEHTKESGQVLVRDSVYCARQFLPLILK